MRTTSASALPQIIRFPSLPQEKEVKQEPVTEPKIVTTPLPGPVTERVIQAKPKAIQKQDPILEKFIKVCFAGLDSLIRCPIRIFESAYNLPELPVIGPLYRALTESIRHGTVSFIKDTDGHGNNFSERFKTTLKQLTTRASENVFGFLAFKPNSISSAFGRMGAGFANMFVRVLPRMAFVAKNLSPTRALNANYLIHDFVGRSLFRVLPRTVAGMIGEQFGINMLLEFLPLNPTIDLFQKKSNDLAQKADPIY